MKVMYSNDTRDFTNWVIEKNDRVLFGLCRMIRDNPGVLNDVNFCDSLENALKLFSLFHGNLNGIYCELVYNLLVHYHVDGYIFLEDILENKRSGKIMKNIMCTERDERVLKLIEENDKLNRTEIATLLARADKSNKWISEIAEDIEYVHDGIKSWEWFYNKHHNDRNTFEPYFEDEFIRKVYEYFHSDEYMNA